MEQNSAGDAEAAAGTGKRTAVPGADWTAEERVETCRGIKRTIGKKERA